MDHDCKITDGMSLTQSHYIEKLIKKYGHEDQKAKSQLHIILTIYNPSQNLRENTVRCKSQLEYASVIDCLLYVMHCSRLDISFPLKC